MNNNESIFKTLFDINVGNHIEKKNGLSYISWSFAWAEVKKVYPDANYKVKLFGENQLPYIYDDAIGYMVFTSVTINNLTHEMWLPVMDNSNKTLKSHSYTYDTKFKKGITVEAATMFDVNKSIMRCLVKNISMFGLGLYIYAGEDLPESEMEKVSERDAKNLENLIKTYQNSEKLYRKILKIYNIKELKDLSIKQNLEVLEKLKNFQSQSLKPFK